ncbi:MAG: hypothetical protein NTU80_03175 [Verrucomicrobia bacterium]|nr:hypothetical protein [Verrucomicrobiota bacterium]
MSQITIKFSNVTLSSNTSSIRLTGGAYALGVAEGLSVSGTLSFSSMYCTTDAISFNVTSGTAFNAAFQAKVTSNSEGTPPSVEVINFTGTVTVTWPTYTGPQTQALESGNLMTLSGYVG